MIDSVFCERIARSPLPEGGEDPLRTTATCYAPHEGAEIERKHEETGKRHPSRAASQEKKENEEKEATYPHVPSPAAKRNIPLVESSIGFQGGRVAGYGGFCF